MMHARLTLADGAMREVVAETREALWMRLALDGWFEHAVRIEVGGRVWTASEQRVAASADDGSPVMVATLSGTIPIDFERRRWITRARYRGEIVWFRGHGRYGGASIDDVLATHLPGARYVPPRREDMQQRPASVYDLER